MSHRDPSPPPAPSPPPIPAAAGAPPSPAPAAPRAPSTTAPATWRLWTALAIVYVVWGSTYLAMRVAGETLPPLLASGTRFVVAGTVICAALALRRGRSSIRLARGEVAGCLLVGVLLMGANGSVMVAEQEVPSALAALIIASVPLWVILLRRLGGERVRAASFAAVAVGFAGVALLLAPGERPEGASFVALLGCLLSAAMWATGSYTSQRIRLPRDPLLTTGWQMVLGGLACGLAGLAVGEAPNVDPAAFSVDSLLALGYLVVFGSIVAFTAYVWLLRHAPISKVATYAYVNPVVAIALGAVILGEAISPLTLLSAAVIVVSVALVIRLEARGRKAVAGTSP